MKRLLLILVLALPCLEAFCCTTAIVSAGASATGRPMLWKQRDGDVNTCVDHIQGDVYAYTALFMTSDTLRAKAYAGVNEAGFAIMNNYSYNIRPEDAPGEPSNGTFMAEALGCCATVADFEALLSLKERPMLLSANFGVIDAEGGAAYFEVGDDCVTRYDVPAGGWLCRTNYSLSGDPAHKAGGTRYVTIEKLMRRHGTRKFDAGFFLRVSRSFVNELTGGDALRCRRSGYIYDRDFIARASTSSAVVIEGVAPGEAPSSGLMWCAVGYPVCSYAVPVWPAAGKSIPALMAGKAPANLFAEELRSSLRTLEWDSNYLDVKVLRRTLKIVRRYERAELRVGRKLDRIFRKKGLDAAAVEEYNAAADARFEAFKAEFEI